MERTVDFMILLQCMSDMRLLLGDWNENRKRKKRHR